MEKRGGWNSTISRGWCVGLLHYTKVLGCVWGHSSTVTELIGSGFSSWSRNSTKGDMHGLFWGFYNMLRDLY